MKTQRMKLIADSGATKTDWCIGKSPTDCRIIQTQGINPFHQSEEHIRMVLSEELLPQLKKEESITHIHFYGAGCTPEKAILLKGILLTFFPQAEISVESDLLGAARSLCGKEKGIACILGTGSNSCEYDGEKIVSNVSPLGYILGDEGSGAVLGKRLVGDCLKRQLPEAICQAFLKETRLSPAEIIDKVYVAGAKKDGDKLLSAGGRVLGATETADTLEKAIDGAYKLVEKIHFDNAFYRHDIGKKAKEAK
jgi:N-acetylglucosamine kinase-like BadF-type ATPase